MALPGPGQLGGPRLPGRVRIADAHVRTRAITRTNRWGRFVSAIEHAGDQVMEELADKMEDRAKRYAPVRTGRLRRSIRALLLNDRVLILYSNVPYADVMERGSRPHLIHGVRANFNWRGGRFVWNDRRYGPIGEEFDATSTAGGREARMRNHFRRMAHSKGYRNWTYTYGATVQHPGTKPHRFMARAFQETWQEARFVMRRKYPR